MKALRAVLLAWCWASPWVAHAQVLTVSAAASLTEALRDIAPLFEALRPGVTLRLNLAASGALLQQVAQGAPVDVLVSADEDTVQLGVARGLLDTHTRRVFAGNQLVLVRPQGGAVVALPDLRGPAVTRLAIGKPGSVPAGRYAQQALQAAGLWDSVQRKLVPADSVLQALDYVARGEVEAAIVYRSDALLMPARVQVAAVLSGHSPIRYPAVVVSSSRQKALAADFVAFLASPPAQAVLEHRGFVRP